jgi:hypothetical protein
MFTDIEIPLKHRIIVVDSMQQLISAALIMNCTPAQKKQ